MRVPTHHDREETTADQMMTPMIDVVFQLLIFFVCASVGQMPESLLPTTLAGGAVAAPHPADNPPPLGEVWLFLKRPNGGPTVVQVNRGGAVHDDTASLRDTLRALAAAAREIPVILDIEPDVPLGEMIRVYDTCRAAGFDSINFATRPDAKKG